MFFLILRYRGIALPLKLDALFPEKDPAAAAEEDEYALRRPSEAQRMKAVADKVSVWTSGRVFRGDKRLLGASIHPSPSCPLFYKCMQ